MFRRIETVLRTWGRKRAVCGPASERQPLGLLPGTRPQSQPTLGLGFAAGSPGAVLGDLCCGSVLGTIPGCY